MKPKHRRLTFVLIGLGLLGVAAALVLSAFDEAIVFFRSPSDLAEKSELGDRRLRLGGLVEEGSVERGTGTEVRFRITDLENAIPVRYTGILPDLLPCHLQSSRLKDLHQHVSYFHLAFSVISLDTRDCRTDGASWPGPDNLLDPGALALGYRLAIRRSLLVFWSLSVTVLCRLLCAITITSRPRLPLSR